MSNIDVFSLNLAVVFIIGLLTYLFSEKTNISSISILVILGMVVGPFLGVVDRNIAQKLFDYVRVFGLVIILFAEGHNLKWEILRKRLGVIGILDTVGLFITAIIAGMFFSIFFHAPFLIGFLFGAIISATDPATLIPLFRQNKVDEEMRTIIVTESIFNDPLGIVLTAVAVALVVPQAPTAKFVEGIARYTTLYPAAVIFFFYEVGVSIAIGLALGIIGYWLMRKLKLQSYAELFSIMMAFGGFAIGEWAQASGFLVATVMGIVFGNHEIFFKRRNEKVSNVVQSELHFNEILSDFATIFIFTLLGASLSMSSLNNTTWVVFSIIIAGLIIFVARPIAGLTILPSKDISWREYLFISFEGPRGVVPSALAGLPLSLGMTYHNSQLIHWGEIILTATVMTVLVTVIVETLWVRKMNKALLLRGRKLESSK